MDSCGCYHNRDTLELNQSTFQSQGANLTPAEACTKHQVTHNDSNVSGHLSNTTEVLD